MNRSEWLEERRHGIGASDAASVLGMNKYKTNVELWREKTGRNTPDDISGKPYVKYGNDAEPLLRELFALDFPHLIVYYDQFGMFRNPERPWLFATLDGWYEIPDGSMGVLEIKTTEIVRPAQWKEWKDRIPTNYYFQVLHQLLATGFDEAILKAQIKSWDNAIPKLTTRHYLIDRYDEQVAADMAMLLEAEEKFWRMVERKEEPALILPKI